MSGPADSVSRNRAGTSLLLWALLMLYGVARVLQIFPSRVPILTVVALHVLPPIIFALIHGAMLYRTRAILIFFTICLVVGNIFENVGVRTGFPFGHYYFTDRMGPKLFAVPILLGLAYLGMAYLSWTLARLILGDVRNPLGGFRVVTLPLVAAFIMVAWIFPRTRCGRPSSTSGSGSREEPISVCPRATSSAGFSQSMSSTSCSRSICGGAQPTPILCRLAIGIKPCCSMRCLRRETSSSLFRGTGSRWFPMQPGHNGK